MASKAKYYTVQEVAKHNVENDCWVIVHNYVFDVTHFLNEHPGGKKILLKVAGTDATTQFDNFHNTSILNKYLPNLMIGKIASAADEEDELSGEKTTFGDMIPFGDPMWYQDWYSPFYKDSHRRLRHLCRQFVNKEIMPYCFEWDEAKQIPKHVFEKVAQMGLLTAVVGVQEGLEKYMAYPLPANIAAEEWDAFHSFIVIDELARCGSGGVLWALAGGLGIGLPPVIHFASDDLKQKVVKDCLAGTKFICLAITEPSGGSDVAGLQTEAKDMGDHYLVNGEKKWITNGVFADFFVVACRTGEAGFDGISFLLIERDMPGVHTRQMLCSGVWPSGTAYVTLEDVRVPKQNLIGKENKGFKYIMWNFNSERMGIVVQANRFARVCVEESIRYANKRKTFGKKLIDHPVIRNKIAHMIRQVESTHAWAEMLTYQATKMPPKLLPFRLGGPIALCKAQATQTFEYCAREAAQIFGGLAYTRGGQGEKIERLYREVRAYAIPGGSEEIMLDLGVRQSMKIGTFMGAKL
ncbi:acyl-CoA dehydrogenase/oxidase [Mycotypha africana]|uniref:acyl-CoA dehydrogenase/oxidase n=1 Tax=Mycotypha africana TaxID=64632 RepID=UPI00230115A9|nr:acyl-CoA dehydrogenase/oxidase [Mycotypha africana]KAI8983971.1 acyl-CoA dehydrogenase/oxidase [Mycotypha africana]